MLRPPTACRKCGKAAESGSICKACEPKHKEDVRAKEKYRNEDPDNARYHRPEWIKLSRILKDMNPICQRIESNGLQCRYPSQISHHLISPKVNPTLFLNASNLVAICRFHHSDTPGEVASDCNRYVPTKWIMGQVYSHN